MLKIGTIVTCDYRAPSQSWIHPVWEGVVITPNMREMDYCLTYNRSCVMYPWGHALDEDRALKEVIK